MRPNRGIDPSPLKRARTTFGCSPAMEMQPPSEQEPIQGIGKKAESSRSRYGLRSNSFDGFPDDLLVSIFVSLSSTATTPADLISTMLTCRRFHAFAMHPLVLANVAVGALRVKAANWSAGAERFLKLCADAGNVEACYTLGMIRFYCLKNMSGGVSLMARAAIKYHSAALHSLAVIQFNGSGGIRRDRNLKAGVTLCARAASLGHVDAMRELGHCLKDGYGIPRNVLEGRRLLVESNAREVAAAMLTSCRSRGEAVKAVAKKMAVVCLHYRLLYDSLLGKLGAVQKLGLADGGSGDGVGELEEHPFNRFLHNNRWSLFSDFGCNVPPPKLHIAHEFMVEWFLSHFPPAGLRLCSHQGCGRPETRRHEFRRCSACGSVNYCSRACQALDWKLRHKIGCSPAAGAAREDDGGGDNHNVGDGLLV